MKAILYAGILLFIVGLVSGCTTAVPPQETGVTINQTPNLLGNWSGTSAGYIGGTGYTDYSGYAIAMRVTQQRNRIFWGNFTFSNQSGYVGGHDFGGVIGRDGKSLTIVERGGGYSYGTLIAPDQIELIHAHDAEPTDVAIDTLKKS